MVIQKKVKNFETKKNYASAYIVEVLHSFNPEIQLKGN